MDYICKIGDLVTVSRHSLPLYEAKKSNNKGWIVPKNYAVLDAKRDDIFILLQKVNDEDYFICVSLKDHATYFVNVPYIIKYENI